MKNAAAAKSANRLTSTRKLNPVAIPLTGHLRPSYSQRTIKKQNINPLLIECPKESTGIRNSRSSFQIDTI